MSSAAIPNLRYTLFAIAKTGVRFKMNTALRANKIQCVNTLCKKCGSLKVKSLLFFVHFILRLVHFGCRQNRRVKVIAKAKIHKNGNFGSMKRNWSGHFL